MRRLIGLLIISCISLTTLGFAANYTATTGPAGEKVLDRAVLPGGSHENLTKTQVIQKMVNAALTALGNEQLAGDARQVNDRMNVTTQGALVNGINAIDAGIALPVITAIANRNNPTASVQVVPVLVTDPDAMPVLVTATGLPPGITVGYQVDTGVPQLQGTLGTPGTYNVTLKVFKSNFRNLGGVSTFDIAALSTFTWIVAP